VDLDESKFWDQILPLKDPKEQVNCITAHHVSKCFMMFIDPSGTASPDLRGRGEIQVSPESGINTYQGSLSLEHHRGGGHGKKHTQITNNSNGSCTVHPPRDEDYKVFFYGNGNPKNVLERHLDSNV